MRDQHSEKRSSIFPHYSAGSGVFSPDDDDDKVEEVPSVADVGTGMHHKTVGQNLQEGLYGEDDEEDVLHLFLKDTKRDPKNRWKLELPAL